MATLHQFTIKYKGAKADRLLPGVTSDHIVRSVFKQDLTALGANHPKTDLIKLVDRGTVSFTFWRESDVKDSNVCSSSFGIRTHTK